MVYIAGGNVNRGAGYGLEVPCIYHLYGPKVFLDCLKKVEIFKKEVSSIRTVCGIKYTVSRDGYA